MPVALSSDAHLPERRRRRVRRRRSSCSTSWACASCACSSGRAAAAGADRRRAPTRRLVSRAGSATTPTGSPTGRPLVLGGVRDRQRARARRPLRRRRARARGDRRAARRRRASATSASTSPTPTSAGATPTRSSCSQRSCAMLAEHGLRDRQRGLHGRCWRRRSSRPHRDAIRARLAGALGLAADARQRQGDAPARGSASSAAARASRRWRSRRSQSRLAPSSPGRSRPVPAALGLRGDARDPPPRHAQRRAAAARAARARARSASTPAGRPSTAASTSATRGRSSSSACSKRFLEHEGYDVELVVNVTDVNDKIYDAARAQGVPSAQLAARDDRGLHRRHRRARARPARPRAAGVRDDRARSSS